MSDTSADTTAARTDRRSALSRRRVKGEQRRQQIFSGALTCFEERGYHETTIGDIAASAGVSTGLIYQYFKDKRDLLFQVIMEIIEAYNRDVPNSVAGVADPLERLQRVAIAYYGVIDKRISATLFSYRESMSLERNQIEALKSKELQTNDLILQCIKECEAEGYISVPDPELATYWIITTAHAWGLKNWRLRKIASFDDYTRSTLRMLLNGMLTEKGKVHFAATSLLDGHPI